MIQQVEVSWTKASRGGAAAAVRNKVPTAFALPEALVAATGDALDRRTALEWRAFALEARTFRLDLEHPDGALAELLGFRLEGDVLHVRLDDSQSRRKPIRAPYGRTLFRLEAGDWGRVEYTGRKASDHGPVYSRLTFSIGRFDGPVARDVFLHDPPLRYRSLASLYRVSIG
jgi:hypothetical protein